MDSEKLNRQAQAFRDTATAMNKMAEILCGLPQKLRELMPILVQIEEERHMEFRRKIALAAARKREIKAEEERAQRERSELWAQMTPNERASYMREAFRRFNPPSNKS